MTRPRWALRRAAEAARRASVESCPDCGLDVLRGPDEDVLAVVVSVEVGPAPPLVATVAWLAGLGVYRLRHAVGDSPGELWRMDSYALGAPPTYPIHIEHDCQHRARGRSWKGPAELVPARARRASSSRHDR